MVCCIQVKYKELVEYFSYKLEVSIKASRQQRNKNIFSN